MMVNVLLHDTAYSPRPHRASLSAAVVTEGQDRASHLLDQIRQTVKDRSRPGHTFREELQMGSLYKQESHLIRDLNANRRARSMRQGTMADIARLREDRSKRAWVDRTPAAVEILIGVLQCETRVERLLGLKEMAMQIAATEADSVGPLHTKVADARAAYEAASLDDRDELRCAWNEARNELNEAQTSTEHIWRELGLLYEENPDKYPEAPALVARALCDGGVIELVNGDAGRVQTRWLRKVMKSAGEELERRLERPARLQVVSIAGVQSSGKSTLLNALFGCNFQTSTGACTRGINMMLIQSRGWGSLADFVLLLDSEGICNPLYQDQAWYDWHNNWLATMSMLSADSCLLLSNNEDQTMVQAVLPMALMSYTQAATTLREAGFASRRLHFVYNRIDPAKAESKLQENRDGLKHALHKAITQLDSREAKMVFKNVEDNHFHYLGPNLNDAEGYGKQVVALRAAVAQGTTGAEGSSAEGSSTGLTLGAWWSLMESLLAAFETQDFALSFASVVKMQAAMERRRVMAEQEQLLSRAWHEAFVAVEKKLKERDELAKAASVPIPPLEEMQLENELKAHAGLDTARQEATAAVEKLLGDSRHQNEANDERLAWSAFAAGLESRHLQLLRIAFTTHTGAAQAEREMDDHFTARLSHLTVDKSLKGNKEAQDRVFFFVFNAFLADARTANPRVVVHQLVQQNWPPDLQANAHQKSLWDIAGRQLDKWAKRLENKLSKLLGGGDQQKLNQAKIEADVAAFMANKAQTHVGPFNVSLVQEAAAMVRGFLQLPLMDQAKVNAVADEVRAQLTAVLQEQQDKWEQEHNLYERFRRKEEDFRKKFDALCSGLEGQELMMELLVIEYLAAAKAYAHSQLLKAFGDAVKNQRWLRDAQALIAEANCDLIEHLERGGLQSVLGALQDRKHVEQVQQQLLDKVAPVVADKHEEAKAEVLGSFDALLSQVIQQKVGKVDITGPRLAEMAKDNLLPGFSLAATAYTTMKGHHDSLIDVCKFVSTLRSRVEKGWPAKPWHSAPKWSEVREHLVRVQGTNQLNTGCDATCPLCKMFCHFCKGHTEKHDCYHQPRGLLGRYWISGKLQDQLVADTCSAAGDAEFWHNDKYVPFPQFGATFPHWNQPQLAYPPEVQANASLRNYLFATYQQDLAIHYDHKPSTVLPVVPPLAEIKDGLKQLTSTQA